MLLRAKTGVATLYQFIAGTVLTFLNGVASIIIGCHATGGAECVTNAFVSLFVVLVFISGLSLLLGIGFLAQERRDPRLALLLTVGELAAAYFYFFEARHANDLFDKLIYALSLGIAVWVIFIALRQSRAGRGRMVTSRRKL